MSLADALSPSVCRIRGVKRLQPNSGVLAAAADRDGSLEEPGEQEMSCRVVCTRLGASKAFPVRCPAFPCSLLEKSLFAGLAAARENRGKCASLCVEASPWPCRFLPFPAKFPVSREFCHVRRVRQDCAHSQRLVGPCQYGEAAGEPGGRPGSRSPCQLRASRRDGSGTFMVSRWSSSIGIADAGSVEHRLIARDATSSMLPGR